MKTISVYVDEERYKQLKAVARQQHRPVAALIREAMDDYFVRARGARSMKEVEPHRSGRARGPSARHGLLDEMRRG